MKQKIFWMLFGAFLATVLLVSCAAAVSAPADERTVEIQVQEAQPEKLSPSYQLCGYGYDVLYEVPAYPSCNHIVYNFGNETSDCWAIVNSDNWRQDQLECVPK